MKKIIFTLASFFIMSWAHATWPTKPVTIVIPFPPGGPADTTIRNLQTDLQKELGVPVIVINMAGANASVAASHVMAERNDNHTFLYTELEFVVGQIASGKYMYRNFTPLTTILTTPFIFYTNTSSPNILERFKAQIKNKSNVNVGYVGSSVAWLDQITSPLTMTLIPYKGGAPLWQDVLGGHVEYAISGAGGVWHRVHVDKTFKPIMLSSGERHPGYPGVPTATELGFKGPRVDLWFTFWAQKNVDIAVQKEFSRIIHKTVAKNKYIQQISKTGYTVVNYNYEETQQYMNSEIAHYEKLPVKQNK
jgi:tripartite-type tricarboxylate transporter receptor subunit TctC